MENKQTAVQWLVEKIQQANPSFKFDALIRQAKEFDKQQIINAHGIKMKGVNDHKCVNGEQYYNENYKSE